MVVQKMAPSKTVEIEEKEAFNHGMRWRILFSDNPGFLCGSCCSLQREVAEILQTSLAESARTEGAGA